MSSSSRHSAGRPASDFTDLVHRLENNSYTAHPIEPPRSVAAGANLHDVAAGVVTQLSERGVRSFHLVGHAFGNRLARMIAADFPDHIASLTLLAAGGYVPIPPKVLVRGRKWAIVRRNSNECPFFWSG